MRHRSGRNTSACTCASLMGHWAPQSKPRKAFGSEEHCQLKTTAGATLKKPEAGGLIRTVQSLWSKPPRPSGLACGQKPCPVGRSHMVFYFFSGKRLDSNVKGPDARAASSALAQSSSKSKDLSLFWLPTNCNDRKGGGPFGKIGACPLLVLPCVGGDFGVASMDILFLIWRARPALQSQTLCWMSLISLPTLPNSSGVIRSSRNKSGEISRVSAASSKAMTLSVITW